MSFALLTFNAVLITEIIKMVLSLKQRTEMCVIKEMYVSETNK